MVERMPREGQALHQSAKARTEVRPVLLDAERELHQLHLAGPRAAATIGRPAAAASSITVGNGSCHNEGITKTSPASRKSCISSGLRLPAQCTSGIFAMRAATALPYTAFSFSGSSLTRTLPAT